MLRDWCEPSRLNKGEQRIWAGFFYDESYSVTSTIELLSRELDARTSYMPGRLLPRMKPPPMLLDDR